jgi:hypothetical protein
MPQKPGFAIPAIPLEAVTRSEVGKAGDKGLERFWRLSCAEPTGVHGDIVEGNTVLPWNARLRMSSA